MADTTGERGKGRLLGASATLFLTQFVHGLVPADTDHSSIVGPIVGSVLLLTSLAATVGAWRRRLWAAPLAGGTGVVVAAGFVLYHATPFHSAATNPYIGEDVGAPALLSVAVTIAAGLWAAYEGLVVPRRSRTAAATAAGPTG